MPNIRDAGAELVVISPEKPDVSSELIGDLKLDFGIVFDDQLKIADSFKLVHELPEDLVDVYRGFGVDLPSDQGTDRWCLPMPARYIVDQNGIVQSADVHADYVQRPEPAETVEKLNQL